METHFYRAGEERATSPERESLDAGLARRAEELANVTQALEREVHEHESTAAQLRECREQLAREIEARERAEKEVARVQRELADLSRHAGMAEVATGVLHNVGNVLNSVNVSATLLAEQVKKSRSGFVGRVAALLKEHAGDLSQFLTSDPKGQRLPLYLDELARQLALEQASALEELDGLNKNIGHIKDIVSMQQNYAKMAGVSTPVKVVELVEDALRMNSSALARHDVKLVREIADALPEITVDRHKVLQILVNLIRNAKYACDDSHRPDKQIVMRVTQGEGRVRISVVDNGVGIPAENLERIFNHGFTTRQNGHGFGLHSGAMAAKELGGTLTVHSEGPGRGATFTLDLPVSTPVAG